MIIDIEQFVKEEEPYWTELEDILASLNRKPVSEQSIPEVRRFHYLYERASSDLGKLATFACERSSQAYLESLVSRAYCEIHEARKSPQRIHPLTWLRKTFPCTVRRHAKALYLSIAAFLVGSLFGGLVITLDPEAKPVIMPFEHLLGNPSDRVAEEESMTEDHLQGRKAQGAAMYMTHNTRVSITTMAAGAFWGAGTLILLFYNGVILGAVALDYIFAGETVFLIGWLLPHGSVEIPAILLAGQAGLLFGGTLIGWRKRLTLSQRMARIGPDIVTIIIGVALLLVLAGIIEAGFSQYHKGIIPYWVKITFGTAQLLALLFYLSRSGRDKPIDEDAAP